MCICTKGNFISVKYHFNSENVSYSYYSDSIINFNYQLSIVDYILIFLYKYIYINAYIKYI